METKNSQTLRQKLKAIRHTHFQRLWLGWYFWQR